jgi:transposase
MVYSLCRARHREYRKDLHKRRNWIHIGSEEAGLRVAAIVSIVETCRRLKIPVRAYLGSILPGLAGFPINRIAELTPSAWAARN